MTIVFACPRSTPPLSVEEPDRLPEKQALPILNTSVDGRAAPPCSGVLNKLPRAGQPVPFVLQTLGFT